MSRPVDDPDLLLCVALLEKACVDLRAAQRRVEELYAAQQAVRDAVLRYRDLAGKLRQEARQAQGVAAWCRREDSGDFLALDLIADRLGKPPEKLKELILGQLRSDTLAFLEGQGRCPLCKRAVEP